MSVRDERMPLTPGTSLYDYALFLRGIDRDGPFPRRGHPVPGQPPEPSRSGLTWAEAGEEVAAALTPLLTDPDPVRAAEAVHLAADALRMPYRSVRAHVGRLPLTDQAAARRTARRLTRTGTSTAAVSVGLALLVRLGEPEDVPVLKVLGSASANPRTCPSSRSSVSCADLARWPAPHSTGSTGRRPRCCSSSTAAGPTK